MMYVYKWDDDGKPADILVLRDVGFEDWTPLGELKLRAEALTWRAFERIGSFRWTVPTAPVKSMKYGPFLSLVVLMLLAVSMSCAHAAETAPARTVSAFYKWYITTDRHLGRQLAEVKALFEPTLYDALSRSSPDTFLANTCPGYVDVGRCPYGTFDPFAYARAAASSYSVGAEGLIDNQVFVDVTLEISSRPKTTSKVTVVLSRRGGHYTISDLLYPHPRYYNFGPVADLRKFLMLTGVMPLDPAARRDASSADGVVKAFYALYVASYGHIEERMLQAKALLDGTLFEDLSTSYETGGGFTVSTCSGDCGRSVPFEPFANDSAPASSYAVGVSRREGTSIFVPVSLPSAGNRSAVDHVTVVVYRHGAWYEIGNFLYDEPRYYYAGPVVDLLKFLGAWNC